MREALKLALEALERGETDLRWKAITAIREALAQPEQKPHSWYSKQENEWMTHKTRMEHEQLNSYTHKVGKFDLALYTTPPQRTWVGLTDEEIWETPTLSEFARAIEAKLKEKNQ